MAKSVLVEYSLRVVDHKLIEQLRQRATETGDPFTEIPELPGVCLDDITGISKGRGPLDVATLRDRIDVATRGEEPTAVIIVRRAEATRSIQSKRA